MGSCTTMTDQEDHQEDSRLSSGGYARRRLVAALTPVSHLQQVPYSVPARPFRVTTTDDDQRGTLDEQRLPQAIPERRAHNDPYRLEVEQPSGKLAGSVQSAGSSFPEGEAAPI